MEGTDKLCLPGVGSHGWYRSLLRLGRRGQPNNGIPLDQEDCSHNINTRGELFDQFPVAIQFTYHSLKQGFFLNAIQFTTMTLIIIIYYDFYMTYLGVSDNRIGPPQKEKHGFEHNDGMIKTP